MIIPLLLFLLACAQLSYELYKYGSFGEKDLSLKGGYFVKLSAKDQTNVDQFIVDLKSQLSERLQKDVEISKVTALGKVESIVIETEVSEEDPNSDITYINNQISDISGIASDDFLSTGLVNSSLGNSFFRQIIYAVIFSFIFMSITVFIYFRSIAPSVAIVACAFLDILCTLATFNLLGYKLSTASIAAFLMLIGYSVDTDILLTTKVLKQKASSDININIYEAIITGITMQMTTVTALVVGLVVVKSPVIQQIMTVLLIGVVYDIINTWIMNVGLIRWFFEKKYI